MHPTRSIALIMAFSALLIPMNGVDATGISISLGESEYTISVDPTDPDQGYLQVHGEVDVSLSARTDTVTVELSVNITEFKGGAPTDRYWLADIVFGSTSVGPSSKIFRWNDDLETFTVTIDPASYEPGSDLDIPVPPGLALDVEGKMVVTATYSGSDQGKRTTTARIFPGSYHLVNLSTPDDDQELSAGGLLYRTINVTNAGNNREDIVIEVGLIDELKGRGWNVSLSSYGRDGIEPGNYLLSNMVIRAPREIAQDETLSLDMSAFTKDIDPGTGDPLSSSEISVKIFLKKSKLSGPDDDDESKDNGSEEQDTDPVMALVVVGLVIVVLVVLVIILFKKGKGGEGDERDPHSSMVRI